LLFILAFLFAFLFAIVILLYSQWQLQ